MIRSTLVKYFIKVAFLYSIRDAICFSDEISVDLVESNPEKARAIKSAISAEDIGGLVKLLKEIGQKNPVIEYREGEPMSVLHSIASEGNLVMFRTISNTLTDLQPKAKSVEEKGATPLHYAVGKVDGKYYFKF